MSTKRIPLQVPDYSRAVFIYQFREVPLGPHVHNNSSQLEEHNIFNYLEYTDTVTVLPVREQTHSMGQLVTGYNTTMSMNCELVVPVIK